MKNSKTCQHIALQSRRLVKYASVCYIISIYVIKTLLFLHTVSPYIKYIRTFVCDQCNTIVAHILIRLLHNYYSSVGIQSSFIFFFYSKDWSRNFSKISNLSVLQKYQTMKTCTQGYTAVHQGALSITKSNDVWYDSLMASI